jgi:hypothetical protein
MAEYVHDKVTMCMLNMETVVSMVTMVEMEATYCLIGIELDQSLVNHKIDKIDIEKKTNNVGMHGDLLQEVVHIVDLLLLLHIWHNYAGLLEGSLPEDLEFCKINFLPNVVYVYVQWSIVVFVKTSDTFSNL